MFLARLTFVAIAAVALLGCSMSSPRAIKDKFDIPGGEYIGKANNSRPESIQYQKLPDHVQYVIQSDSLVTATYENLQVTLTTEESKIKIAKYLFLMPGIWDVMRSDSTLKKGFRVQKDKYQVGVRKKKFKFHYAIPKEPKSSARAWKSIVDQVKGSEVRIRAISTAEMDQINRFTPFMIVEPIFVVNDKFVLGFNKSGELELIDELSFYQPFMAQFDEAMYGK